MDVVMWVGNLSRVSFPAVPGRSGGFRPENDCMVLPPPGTLVVSAPAPARTLIGFATADFT